MLWTPCSTFGQLQMFASSPPLLLPLLLSIVLVPQMKKETPARQHLLVRAKWQLPPWNAPIKTWRSSLITVALTPHADSRAELEAGHARFNGLHLMAVGTGRNSDVPALRLWPTTSTLWDSLELF